MIKFFCLFGLVLWSGGLMAQPIPVQTGEHASFTRVVLTLPPDAEWRVGRVEDGYGILVDGASTFDLDGFFDIIPRTRIADVSISQENALVLALDCDCRAEPFLERPGILVVDIFNGAPTPDAAAELALFPELAPEPAAEPSRVVQAVPDLELTQMPPTFADIAAPNPYPPLEVLEALAEERQKVESLETELAESLTRAASQGLLELREDLKPVTTRPETTDTPEFADPPADQLDIPTLPGINARSSVDTALGGMLNARDISAELLSCWPDAHVAVADWGTDAPFPDQIAAARAAITGEFDRIDASAVERLSRLYIHFGFGRETVQTLNIDGVMSSERDALIALAEIIDGDPLTDKSIMQQVHCPNDVALWAMLAMPEAELPQSIDARRLALQFRGLPENLQMHLRPRFAARLLDVAETDLAETVISSGPPAAEAVETAIVASDLAIQKGDPAAAEQTLSTLAETNARMTPDALIKLVDLQIAENTPVSPEAVADAQTMLFENRDLPIAGELARVVVAGHLHSGARQTAWQSLQSLSDMLSSDQRVELEAAIIAATTADGSDAEFVELVFSNALTPLTPEAGNRVAARLLSLGFPEQAAGFLGDPAQGAAMAERRYLRAEAAVMTGAFDLAQAHLAGINTARAAKILSFGPDGVPLMQLSQTQAEGQADDATIAWRNGDWSVLEQSDDPLLSEASALVRNEPATPVGSETPLASSRALVAEASAARETVEALISRFDAPLLAGDPP